LGNANSIQPWDNPSESDPERSKDIMKKIPNRKRRPEEHDALLPKYRFDRSKLKPNRFAARMPADTIAVVLEPDVAAVFKSSKRVNALLRSMIPSGSKPKRKRVR
jgi:hypothetical protein